MDRTLIIQNIDTDDELSVFQNIDLYASTKSISITDILCQTKFMVRFHNPNFKCLHNAYLDCGDLPSSILVRDIAYGLPEMFERMFLKVEHNDKHFYISLADGVVWSDNKIYEHTVIPFDITKGIFLTLYYNSNPVNSLEELMNPEIEFSNNPPRLQQLTTRRAFAKAIPVFLSTDGTCIDYNGSWEHWYIGCIQRLFMYGGINSDLHILQDCICTPEGIRDIKKNPLP